MRPSGVRWWRRDGNLRVSCGESSGRRGKIDQNGGVSPCRQARQAAFSLRNDKWFLTPRDETNTPKSNNKHDA